MTTEPGATHGGQPLVAAEGMPAAERPVVFACAGERLFGMLHAAPGETGVVVVVGGPQYRVGSHRHFVELARGLADRGHPVLRFDMRGMGDSTGPMRPFDDTVADIAAAVDTLLAHQPQLQHVVLWGLCDGASAALLYLQATADRRVGGLCLLNPWVRSTQSLAQTHVRHYYRDRLRQAEFWRKLLTGRVAMGALTSFWRAVRQSRQRDNASDARAASYQARMAQAWRSFDGPILVVLSANDYTAKEFLAYAADHAEWAGLLDRANVQTLQLDSADHTLSSRTAKQQLDLVLADWLASWAGRPARADAVGALPMTSRPLARRSSEAGWGG